MRSPRVLSFDTYFTTGYHQFLSLGHKLGPGGCGLRTDGILPVAPPGSGHGGLLAGTTLHGHRWNPHVGHSCLRLLCHLSGTAFICYKCFI